LTHPSILVIAEPVLQVSLRGSVLQRRGKRTPGIPLSCRPPGVNQHGGQGKGCGAEGHDRMPGIWA